jgi:undecaprenyl-diphosphatase
VQADPDEAPPAVDGGSLAAFGPLRRAGGRVARWAHLWAGSENRAALLLCALGIALTIASMLLARWIAHEVLAKETQAFDERMLLRIDAAKDRFGAWRPALDNTMTEITSLGSPTVLGLLAVGATGYLWLARRRGEALLAAAVAGGSAALNGALKHWIARPRPSLFAHGHVYTSSFPSGHSMSSMAIYLSLGIFLARLAPTWSARVFATSLAIGTALLVAFSRIYEGVHYPTDVAAGALFGLAYAAAVLTAAEVYRRTREAPGSAGVAGGPARG